MDWKPIDSAPKDGSLILGLTVFESSRANDGEPWVAVFHWVDYGNSKGEWHSHQWEQDFVPSYWVPLDLAAGDEA